MWGDPGVLDDGRRSRDGRGRGTAGGAEDSLYGTARRGDLEYRSILAGRGIPGGPEFVENLFHQADGRVFDVVANGVTWSRAWTCGKRIKAIWNWAVEPTCYVTVGQQRPLRGYAGSAA